ncbi:hypothetical protein Tco_0508600 [Tanacetum coccineum]
MVKFVFHLLDLSSGIILLYHKLLEFNPDNLSSVQLLQENTDSVRSNQRIRVPAGPVFLLGLLVLAIVAAYASRATATLSSTSFLMAAGSGVVIFPADVEVAGETHQRGNLVVYVIDLIGDEDPTNEDGDIGMGDSTRVSVSLGGGISSGGKKYQESNIGDSGNTGDGDKTSGGSIGACGGIGGSLAAALYTCIYGSS